jgi:hypothetical protein
MKIEKILNNHPQLYRYKQASHWHVVKEGMPEHRNTGISFSLSV